MKIARKPSAALLPTPVVLLSVTGEADGEGVPEVAGDALPDATAAQRARTPSNTVTVIVSMTTLWCTCQLLPGTFMDEPPCHGRRRAVTAATTRMCADGSRASRGRQATPCCAPGSLRDHRERTVSVR